MLVGQDGKPLDGVTAIVSPSEGAVDVASWPLHLPAGTLGVVFCVEVGRLDSCMVLGPSDLTPVVTFEPELASYHPTDRPVWCGVGVSSTPDGAMDIAGGTPRTECGLELTGLSPTGYCVLDPVAYEGMNPMQVLRGIVESGHPVVCQPGGSGAMGLRAPRDGEATKTVSGRLQVTP